MKTTVLLRKKQKTKKIIITDNNKPNIDKYLSNKWQNILDIIVDLVDVSVALIMKIKPKSMEVFLCSENDNSFFKVDKKSLCSGLYCETVIGENKELYVPNALKSNRWQYSKKIDSDIISYYGLPIKWPDGSIYGTICIQDKSEIKLKKTHRKLFKNIKKSIENDLEMLITNQKLKKGFNDNSDMICFTNTKGDFLKVNKNWPDLLGYEVNELENENYIDFIHPDDIKKTYKVFEKLKADKNISNFINRFKDKQGKYRNIKWKLNYNSKEKCFYASAKDISCQMFNNKKDLENQQSFQKTLAEISTNLLDINASNFNKKINFSLKKISKLFNIDRSYVLKFNSEFKQFSITHEWCKKGIKSHKNNLQNFKADTFPWWMNKLFDNEIIYIDDIDDMSSSANIERKLLKIKNIKSLIVNPIFIENNFYGFFGFDSTKNKKRFSQHEIKLLKTLTDILKNAFTKYINSIKIKELTYKDNLTGLYNRKFFETKISEIDRKKNLPLSVISADINGLKIINDSLGHQKGDSLIIKCANLLTSVTRDKDIISRQGGDEFLILLPKTNKKETEKIIQKIKGLSNKISTKEKMVNMALGNAIKKNKSQDINKILKIADNQMYQNKLSNNKSIKNKIVKNLLNSLEVKSNETKMHSVRMTKLAIKFGEKLCLDNSEINKLSLLATLHDIGKISISEKILKKPGRLTKKEWEIIKNHPENGYKIANSSEEFSLIANEIYAHHERWDGAGYPRGLKKKQIPYLARMLSIIDAYDVMTNDRPYSKAISKTKALKEIRSCAGSQFDPNIATSFIKMMEK